MDLLMWLLFCLNIEYVVAQAPALPRKDIGSLSRHWCIISILEEGERGVTAGRVFDIRDEQSSPRFSGPITPD